MRNRLVLAIGAVALGLLLAGCGTTIQQRAYALGQTYSIVQKGAIGYLKVAKPSADVADKIVDVNAKAQPQVENVIKCAIDLVELAGTDALGNQLGLSASEVADAKAEACESALAQANVAVDAASNAMKGE